MTTYRMTIFTEDNYHRYMSGYNNYNSEYIYIAANSKEEAIAIAQTQRPDYIVNKFSVKDVETIQAEEEKFKAWEEEKAIKEKQAKERRKATEQKNAEKAGLTVKEYRAEKARKAKITRLTNEIAELEKEIERKKAALKRISR